MKAPRRTRRRIATPARRLLDQQPPPWRSHRAPTTQLELAADLALALGREVDVLDLERAPLPILERIVKEGVLVREARPGVSASWRSRTLATLETDLPGFHRMRDAWLRRVAERGL